MQKNSITNKITPCCGLPFSVIYWWVSNLTLNSESDRQFIISKISQNGTISIDGWKVLVNSGTLESDASLTKAEFLAWFDCNRQPTCEQLKLIIEGFKLGNYNPLDEYGVGWTEVSNFEFYNGKIIKKIIDYTGGIGTIPNELQQRIGKYYSSNADLTDNKDLAVDFKGEVGNSATANIPKYEDLTFPVEEKSMFYKDGVIWVVKEGQTLNVNDAIEEGVKLQSLGAVFKKSFNKTDNEKGSTDKAISDYIGDFSSSTNGEIETIDLTSATWENGKYMRKTGVFVDHPNTRFLKIDVQKGDTLLFKYAIVNDVATYIFIGNDNLIEEGFTEASNKVYSFNILFTKSGSIYLNQNLDAPIVEYIILTKSATNKVSLIEYVEDKFKVFRNDFLQTIPIISGRDGCFLNLHSSIVGVTKYNENVYISPNFNMSQLIKVKQGQRLLLTTWISWNGAQLFNEDGVLTHKLIYETVQGYQINNFEIIIPEDGYFSFSYDKTKPFGLKMSSSEKQPISLQELYDEVGNSIVKTTDKTYIGLPKPSNVWTLNVVGVLPTADGEKKHCECVFNDGQNDFLKCKIEVALQGQSSLTNPKKNFTFDLLNSFGDALQLKIGGFIASDSWHLKGFQKDVSMLRDNLTGSLWYQIRKSASFPSCTLTTLPLNVSPTASDSNYFEEDARFFADGIPVEMYVNNAFQGLYIFRLKKSRQNYKLDNKLKTNIMLEFDWILDLPNGLRLLDWNNFDFKQFELKSPKLSGYSAGGVINDSAVMTSINGLWSWTNAIFNNLPTDESKVDLTAWIDYLIACEVADHWDGFSQNIIIISHDGVRFAPYIYDCDHDWGLMNNESVVRTTKTQFMLDVNYRPEESKVFWTNFRNKYQTQIKSRYTDLRKSGIVSVQNIERTATEFIKPYGSEHFKREFAKWGYGLVPSNGKASLRQILQTANASIEFLDTKWLNT